MAGRLKALVEAPGWLEWKQKQIERTLIFDTHLATPTQERLPFALSEEINAQYDMLQQYVQLDQTILSLKECEHYFRRYPFRNGEVGRASHMTNICEMYYSRFYEFETRLKLYLNTIKDKFSSDVPVGEIVRAYKTAFNRELRVRNSVHHRERYSDIAIRRVNITEFISLPDVPVWKQHHLRSYRKAAREWTQRVRSRAKLMDEFMEIVAAITLKHCAFLSAQSHPCGEREND